MGKQNPLRLYFGISLIEILGLGRKPWNYSRKLLGYLRTPPLKHHISIYNIYFMQVPPNGLWFVTGFLLLSLIWDLRLTLEDFLYCYHSGKSRKGRRLQRYLFFPKKWWVWFIDLVSKDSKSRQLFLFTGNWQSPDINLNVFPICRGFSIGNFFT